MNKKITGFLYAIIISMFLLTIPTLHVYSMPDPRVYVEPELNMFSTETTTVGDTFTVNVDVADFADPGVFAYQFRLYYDNTLLEGTAVVLPEGHFLTPTLDPASIFITTLKIYQESGYVDVALTLLGEEPGKTGSGTLVTVTFEIIKAPAAAEILSCDLELRDVIFADPDVQTIEVILEHGYYEFSPPRPLVYLSVEPSTAGAAEVGDEVIVDVMINEVEEEIKLIGVQWQLNFNTTLLSVVDVTEGDFFKNWAETAGLDPATIYFFWLQEKDYVISFTIYTEFVIAPPTTFPEGSGILATITFNAAYKPETGKASCDLLLDEEFVILLDVDENEIPVHHLEHGTYFIPVKPGDLNFDDKIDILDIGIFGKAYGSTPGHIRWNPLADVVRDKVINILDVITIAKNFGN